MMNEKGCGLCDEFVFRRILRLLVPLGTSITLFSLSLNILITVDYICSVYFVSLPFVTLAWIYQTANAQPVIVDSLNGDRQCIENEPVVSKNRWWRKKLFDLIKLLFILMHCTMITPRHTACQYIMVVCRMLFRSKMQNEHVCNMCARSLARSFYSFFFSSSWRKMVVEIRIRYECEIVHF